MSGTVTAPGNQLHLKLFILCYKNMRFIYKTNIFTCCIHNSTNM